MGGAGIQSIQVGSVLFEVCFVQVHSLMWKIKLFECNRLQDLEPAVNKWLAENPRIEIAHIAQSESGGGEVEWSISFTVLYKKIGS